MVTDIMDYISRHKRFVFVVGCSIVFIGLIISLIWYFNHQPIPLKTTNLANVSDSEKNKAVEQMRTPIKNMPNAIDTTTADYLENQLAYILRQKYGTEADSLSGVVRLVLGSDTAGGYSMYVDIPAKNETYLAYVNLANHIGSFACAPQSQQMNPTTSRCYNIPSVDTNNFPNG